MALFRVRGGVFWLFCDMSRGKTASPPSYPSKKKEFSIFFHFLNGFGQISICTFQNRGVFIVFTKTSIRNQSIKPGVSEILPLKTPYFPLKNTPPENVDPPKKKSFHFFFKNSTAIERTSRELSKTDVFFYFSVFFHVEKKT